MTTVHPRSETRRANLATFGVMPGISATVTRRLGGEKIAVDLAAGQLEKRP